MSIRSLSLAPALSLLLVASLTLALSSPAHAQYCSAWGGGDEHVSGVSFGDINTSTGYSTGGYAGYTLYSTVVETNTSYPIVVENGVGYIGDRAAVWCDWNQDGDFYDAGEQTTLQPDAVQGTWQFNGIIAVPAGALPGLTRMRVRICYYASSLVPCGGATYGEVEDYSLEVNDPASGSVSLYPTDDASVCQQSPTTNYGSSNSVSAGASGSNYYRGYFKFDLSSLPTGVRVTSATLRLSNNFISIPAPTIRAHYCSTDSWYESSITWNTAPAYDSAYSDSGTPSGDYLSLDVTDQADSALNDNGVCTIVLARYDALGGGGGWWSKENTWLLQDRPRLTVNFEPITGDTDILYPTDDASICEQSPGDNYGSSNSVSAGVIGANTYRGYLRYDLSSLPGGVRITNATLRLANNFISIPAPTIEAHYGIPIDWSESTITWNNAPTFTSSICDSGVPSGDYLALDVTEHADRALTENRIYTVVLTHDDAATGGAGWWSRENTYMGEDRPRLTVTYEPLFSGGAGSFRDPYRIETLDDLLNVGLNSDRWSQHFLLCNDLDLSSISSGDWTPIGNGTSMFTGTFNGDNHTLSGSHDEIFGGIGTNGRVLNLRIVNPDLYAPGSDRVGALVGTVDYQGAVLNCSVEGGAVTGDQYVGGLVGYCKGIVSRCFTNTSVSGSQYVGGLIGYCYGSRIDNSYALGSVGAGDIIGGLIGYAGNSYKVTSCHAAAAISGMSNTGGLIAVQVPYATDPSDPYYYEPVVDSFWDTVASGQPSSAAGTPLNTAQMQQRQTFLDAGWDLLDESANGPSEDWFVGEPNYPVLTWQLDPQPPLPTFAGGDGSAETPYLLATAEHMNGIGHNTRLMNSHFQLTADVDLAGKTVFPIGDFADPFTGTFDGGNRIISNISITQAGPRWCIGLFPRVEEPNTVIQNLTLLQVSVDAPLGLCGAALVGQLNQSAAVRNCRALDVDVRAFIAGGLIGAVTWYSHVVDCSVTGTIVSDLPSSLASVGGLAAEHHFFSTTKRCAADVNVSGNYFTGCLIGSHGVGSTLSDSFARGSATGLEDGSSSTGGLLGRNSYRVERCYAAATVTGLGDLGAFAGMGTPSTSTRYYDSFFDNEYNPILPGIGDGNDPNVIGLSTAQLYDPNTFISRGWDFVGESANGAADPWTICEFAGYPRLAALIPAADFVCPDGVDLVDYALFAHAWLATPADPRWDSRCNLYADSLIDIRDLLAFSRSWLRTLGP
ncbi:MAG: DNRLRE domain-containing protein [Sedimentisphaerales bacterium]|nr:DNRLRE domain-containing protein [Sedimentisphaerales bacterium]